MSQLKQLHKAINKALNAMQKRYDLECQHSINKEAQRQWGVFITNDIKTLDAYAF